MILSQHTKTLLSTINDASGKTLKRSMDIGTLIEIAEQHSMQDQLDDLAFSSKFIVKSFELMQRIGKDGNGYEKLSKEFSDQIQKAQALIKQFLDRADGMTKAHFAGNYLEMNTLTMQNLMQLFHDLGWYKNYQIDQRN
ncbi:MAG: hypothetical protein Q8L88_16280 [Bacteroidota bacterium]|nr:hypothetical protein [Bacteroidota bacterium]